MINLPVDEAYAFDYLSILEIKNDKNEQSQKSWANCRNYIKSQVGGELFTKIIDSKEYQNLLLINTITFNAVERARYKNDITAKEVDNANMERHYAKIALQNKFFSNKITEQKT
jgi:hypothetical protein